MKIQAFILHRIRSQMFNFLWGGSSKIKGIHLENWKLLFHPLANGGWNIKDLNFFSEALRLKNLWNVLMGSGLWSYVIKSKYLKHLSVANLLRLGVYQIQNTSAIWNGFLQILDWITSVACSRVGNGASIRIGIDLIAGMEQYSALSMGLIHYLNDYRLHTLDQIRVDWLASYSGKFWMNADEMELGGIWNTEWELYTHSLSALGIRFTSTEDQLVWATNKKNGMVTVKLAYLYILKQNRLWMLL